MLAMLPAAASAADAAPAGASISGNARVDRLLSQMNLEEKISLIHGAAEPAATDHGDVGYWPGLPRLGIPPMRLANGPTGVSLPATMGLAATFSRRDAQATGVVIGRAERALGIQLVLEPTINLFRDEAFWRATSTFGEDPFLTGEIAAARIKGTQSQGVMAQAKHYVAYDGGSEVTVDPQTLREVYVAPFAAAIEAGVASIMCAYNRVNGALSCGNENTLNTVLRNEIGFKGFVTSDWGAIKDTVFINRGADLDMPGLAKAWFEVPAFTAEGNKPAMPPQGIESLFADVRRDLGRRIPEESGAAPPILGPTPALEAPTPTEGMLAAVREGKVGEATIARAAGRILLQMDRFGFLDHAPSLAVSAEAIAPNVKANDNVSLQTAQDAAVLLKNDGALPLSTQALKSLALIGPGAGQTIATGTPGPGQMPVESPIGPYQVMRQMLGSERAHITYAVANDMTAVAIPASQLSHGGQPGLMREDGTIDAELDFTRANSKALPAGSIHQWSGTLTAPVAGRYFINLQILGALGSVSIDGEPLSSTGNVLPTTDGLDNNRGAVELSAGKHALAVSVTSDPSGAPVQVRLAWSTPQRRHADYAAAVSAAKAAHTAVVFAWTRGAPTFALPGDQDQLIADIAAANPNTVVVLNISQPIAMPWLNRVKGILLMWYPGDQGGSATANLLLGQVSPAGRLPFTWPVRLTDNVANDPNRPERSSAGVNGKTEYSEGIFMGYRWFDQQQIKPLFPFGFGLSYTSFEYSNLRTAKAADGGLDVSFTLRNSGKRAADEVPQVYLGAPSSPPSGAQFALRALAGFERVSLVAGERKSVKVHVPLGRFEYWDTASSSWKRPAGARPVSVGASSRDLRLNGTVMD